MKSPTKTSSVLLPSTKIVKSKDKKAGPPAKSNPPLKPISQSIPSRKKMQPVSFSTNSLVKSPETKRSKPKDENLQQPSQSPLIKAQEIKSLILPQSK